MRPIDRTLGRRPAPRVLLAALLLAGLTACGAPAASSPPSVAAPTAASPVTAPPTAAPPTPVAGGPGEVAGTITARNIAFEPTAATVPADTAFVLVLDNADSGVPHGLQVQGPDGAEIVTSAIITGLDQVALPVPALAAGSYAFVCPVHPSMTGTLTAE